MTKKEFVQQYIISVQANPKVEEYRTESLVQWALMDWKEIEKEFEGEENA